MNPPSFTPHFFPLRELTLGFRKKQHHEGFQDSKVSLPSSCTYTQRAHHEPRNLCSIDTPGVIDRVSTLFRGHPSLIQGFNTFLPPGYRIECRVSTNADGTTGGPGSSNVITVTTPLGVTTRTQAVSGPASSVPTPNSAGSSSTLPPHSSAQPSSSHPPAPIPRSASTSSSSIPAPASTAGSSRLPPLPNIPAPPAPPRAISPPAPIPPFGTGPNNRERGGAQTWQQQQQNGAGVYGAGVNGGARGRQTSQGALSVQQQQQQQQPSQRPAVQPNQSIKPTPIARAPSQDQAAPPRSQPVAHAPTPPAATAAQSQAETPTSAAPAQPQIMEFNHAITYVNKIKTRFAKEPETYKTFLEILQTYQKDGRPIQEVRSSVTLLYSNFARRLTHSHSAHRCINK